MIGMLSRWRIGKILLKKKTRLLKQGLMDWQALMFNVMLAFLNTLLIKGTNIYFGHKDKVYVVSKQLIVDVFGICVEGT
jgi:hypothetical protein